MWGDAVTAAACPTHALALLLTIPPSALQVHLMAEELSSCRDVFTMQVSASGLKNVDLLSKSDPFLEINSQDTRGRWKPVFKTEVGAAGERGGARLASKPARW